MQTYISAVDVPATLEITGDYLVKFVEWFQYFFLEMYNSENTDFCGDLFDISWLLDLGCTFTNIFIYLYDINT